MKKFFLLMGIVFLNLGLVAQSLEILSFDTLVVGDATTSNDIFGYAVVRNNSSITQDVRFKRIDANYNALTDSNAICWGLCFTPNISVSPPAFTRQIAPGATDTAITHVYPDLDGFTREGSISYVFFNAFDPTDAITYSVKYRVEGMPIGQPELEAQTNLSVYPNPAQDIIRVDYRLGQSRQANFELINMVGSRVFSKTLQQSEGRFQLDLSQLSSGIYFYTLKTGSEVLHSRKLVVE
jgi:hypothetical protein